MDNELKDYLQGMEARIGNRLDERLAGMESRFNAKIDGAVDSLVRVMSDMEARLEIRIDRLENSAAAMALALSGIDRTLGREAHAAKGTEIARFQQQRAID